MLAMKLKPVKFQQGDRIFTQGDVASEMYFTCRGTAEAFDECNPNESYATFAPGTFFGEIGLLYEQKRTASIRAVSELLVFKLTKLDLESVLREYPEINEKIKEEAKLRSKLIEERQKTQLDTKQKLATDVDAVRERLKQVD